MLRDEEAAFPPPPIINITLDCDKREGINFKVYRM